MEVTEKRRHNLRAIRKRYPYQKDLANELGISEAQLSQLLMDPEKKGFRNIGKTKAREIEDILDLDPFELDQLDNQVDEQNDSYREPEISYFSDLEHAAKKGEYSSEDIQLIKRLGQRLRVPKARQSED